MSKEELFNQGWELIYSGSTGVKAWGEFMVYLHHSSGRKVSGYGANEVEAFNDAVAIIQKPLEKANEVSH